LAVLPGFTDEDWKFTETFATELWFRGFAKSMEALSLGMGPLMHDLLRDQKDPKIKAFFYSGHDTTIYPVLVSLGIHHNQPWVSYAANVVIETWQDKNNDLYTRTLFNGRPMALPACKDAHLSGDATFCQLDAFRKHLEKIAISRDEYTVKCKAVE
jgi:hypothetical protein